jgi:hypothetical protein
MTNTNQPNIETHDDEELSNEEDDEINLMED